MNDSDVSSAARVTEPGLMPKAFPREPRIDGESSHRSDGKLEKVEAVLREERLPAVLKALESIGYRGITVSRVQGHGRQRGSKLQWRGMVYRTELLPKVKIEMIVHELDTDDVINTICEHARTSAIGDGKIWVTPVSKLVRVRTGEAGHVAV